MFFDKPFNIITTPDYNECKDNKNMCDGLANGAPTNKLRKDVATFHTFMLMNIFNMINCRVVNEQQDNVFKTIFNNRYFWFIFILELAVQNGMVLVGNF